MSFFQKSVVSKYLNNLNKETVSSAFLLFKEHFLNPDIQKNIRSLKEQQYQEGFLNDLFVKVLGYTMSPTPNYNLQKEVCNVTDSKKADGAIIINGNVRAVIELKDTKTMDLGKVETQAFGYKNAHKDCPYVIVSNFEKLRLYVDNYTEFIEFNLFTLSEEDFTLLYLILSFESIEKDIPKKLKDETVNQDDITTKKLYNDYSVFKKELFQNLIVKNPNFDKLTLFKKSQKLIDRLLFIFFAEDRGLLPPNSVRQKIQDWQKLGELDSYIPLYSRFQKFFGYLNTGYQSATLKIFAYNGGLFEPDEVLDSISIDDEILNENTLRLSRYDFETEVDVNILGHIFEHSLNEIEEIQSELEGKVADKSKSKRKKDGIFYTPKYITKYIVENTLGTLCSEKRIEFGLNDDETEETKRKAEKKDLLERIDSYRKWLLELTICDPACGSGAFLNQALDFLLNEHRRLDELTARTLDLPIVFSDIENSVLENNIFGVDINEEAVEIAKLSLWLRTAQRGRKLNTLSNNIKCGNSLIDDPAVAGDKAFNWQEEFPKIFVGGGFDVVIGNPPYVRADTDDIQFQLQREWLTKHYETLYEKWDLMTAFFEKGLNLLDENGKFGFIASNSITTSKFAFKLQDWIINNFKIRSIDYYDNFIVFENVGVVPITIIIDKNKLESENIINKYYRKTDFSNYIIKQVTISDNYNLEINELRSLIFKKEYSKTYIKIDNILLGNICFISKGMAIHAEETKYKAEFSKDDLISEFQDTIHSKKYIEGKYIKRYKIDEFKFLEWNTDRVPKKLSRPTFTELYVGEKLMRGAVTDGIYDNTGIICNHSIFIFRKFIDLKEINNLSINNSITKNNEKKRDELEEISKGFDLKYILSIINSKYAIRFLNNIRRHRLENYFYPDDFRNLPIPDISPEAQQPFIEKADLMLKLNKDLQEGKNTFITFIKGEYNLDKVNTKLEEWYTLPFDNFTKELEKLKVKLTSTQKYDMKPLFDREAAKLLAIKSEIETTDREIDQMVYKLYDLTDEEIKIVEGE